MTIASKFKNELLNSGLVPLFEIEVKDINDNIEYILCDIEVNEKDGKLYAYRDAVSQEEEQSNKIAFDSVEIDEVFCLVEHLQELYSEVENSILFGDLYEQI